MNYSSGKLSAGNSWEIYLKDQFASKKHWHNELEVIFMIKGKMKVNMDDDIYHVEEGEVFIVNRGAVHYYEEPEEEYEVGIVKFAMDFFSGLSKETITFFKDFYRYSLYIKEDDKVKTYLKAMLDLLHVENPVIQESTLMARIIDLTVHLEAYPQLIQQKIASRKNNDSDVLSRMKEYLTEHLNEKITLTDIADHLGFSESYCSKYIKKKTNMNFLEYLSHARIMEAENMLRTTDDSVTEIAYATGFTSIQSFNRVFKSLCGVSPTEYRKRLHDKKQGGLDKK